MQKQGPNEICLLFADMANVPDCLGRTAGFRNVLLFTDKLVLVQQKGKGN
jgi:hypothetical protein